MIKYSFKNCHGDSLLHMAANYGQIDTINFLINKLKYSPHFKGRDGKTILHLACHQGRIELTELLLT